MKLMWFVPPSIVTVAEALRLAPGAALETVRTRGSDEQFEQLSSGQCDAVITAMDNVFAWNLRPGPQDFCIVAQIERTTPLMLVAQPGIATPADLKGASLLVDAPGNGFVVALRALLQDAGLNEGDYRLVEAGGVKERLDALLSGAGQATLLGPPFDVMAIAQGKSVITTVQQSYPIYPGQGLVVRRAALPALRAELSAWLKSLRGACSATTADAVAMRAALLGGGMDAADADRLMAAVPATLVPDRPGFDVLVTMRKRLGLPGTEPGYDGIVDLSAMSE